MNGWKYSTELDTRNHRIIESGKSKCAVYVEIRSVCEIRGVCVRSGVCEIRGTHGILSFSPKYSTEGFFLLAQSLDLFSLSIIWLKEVHPQ